MKISLSIDIEDLTKKPVDEWTPEDEETIDLAKSEKEVERENENVVVLDKEESQVKPIGADPFKYVVKKGDTLKKICKKFSISYGELVNHMLEKVGNVYLYPEMELEIPRHFLDTSKA